VTPGGEPIGSAVWTPDGAIVLFGVPHAREDDCIRAARAALDHAADDIDADPHDARNAGRGRALRVRALVEGVATDVMGRVGRALGAGPLCHDEAHSRRVADLTVYLRQHHAERSLAELGELVAEQGTTW